MSLLPFNVTELISGFSFIGEIFPPDASYVENKYKAHPWYGWEKDSNPHEL